MLTVLSEIEDAIGGCLETDDLVAMLEGRLPPERVDVVIQHVDRCASCAEVLANLGSIDVEARRVDRYQIERVLGTGGMGIVYAAFDPELQRRVAIKLVRPDAANDRFQAMMLREARTLARVSHPNVVAVHDVGEHDGEIFLATELVDGVTLAEWQSTKTSNEVVGAWLQAARGLAAAHAEGVVHRDVKPSNILVGRDGRVRIGDFGIAHVAATSDIIRSSVVAGTPAYMAPEQKAGIVDARSDQFSTCVGIAEALTGTRPAANDVISLPDADLAAALTRGLRSIPDERFPGMDDLAEALAAAIASRPPRPRSRKPLIGAAIGASLVAAAAVGYIATRSPAVMCNSNIDATVWSKARRAKIAALPALDATPAIEHWVATWTAAAADVCAARDEAAVRAKRERCLADASHALDELLDAWEEAAPRTAFKMLVAIDELPHVAACSAASVAVSDPAVIAEREDVLGRAGGQAKTDPRGAAATLRAAIAKGPRDFSRVNLALALVSLLDADEITEVETLATAVRADILALGGDIALEAELDLRLGQALGTTDRRAASIAAIEHGHRGMVVAHGEGSIQEASALVILAGAYYRRDGITSPEARAAGKRADEIWAKHHISMPSTILPNTPAELIESVKKTMAETIETFGQRSESAFDAEFGLMNAYKIAEQPEEAMVHARLARELGDRLKLHSGRVAFVRSEIASMLIDKGQPDEALPIAREAETIAAEIGVAGELATARAVIGQALLDLGRPVEALEPLRYTLGHRVSTNDIARIRGNVRFMFAQALWASDRERALDEARVARGELESAFATPELDPKINPVAAGYLRRDIERRLAKLERWLAARTK